MVEAILLPAGDDTEPMPVLVNDHTDINRLVGGPFDAYVAVFTADKFAPYLEDTGKDIDPDTKVTVVGYLHDEGRILNLPLNKLATLMFAREFRGDVVIVGGDNSQGVYDGDNHELPVWFADCVYHTLKDNVAEVDDLAENTAAAFRRAIREGLLTELQAKALVITMGELTDTAEDEELIERLSSISEVLLKYHIARQVGCPKWTKGSILGDDADLEEILRDFENDLNEDDL